MGYDKHERPSVATGAIIAVVIVLLLLGGLLVAGAAAFFLVARTRASHQEAVMQREMAMAQVARQEADMARAMAEEQMEAAVAQHASDTAVASDGHGESSLHGHSVHGHSNHGHSIGEGEALVTGADEATDDAGTTEVVRLDDGGQLSFRGEEVDIDGLTEGLRRAGADSTSLTVSLRVDPDCPYRAVVQVQQACKDAGVRRFSISVLDE